MNNTRGKTRAKAPLFLAIALAAAAFFFQGRVAYLAWRNATPGSGAKAEMRVQERRFASVRACIQGKLLAEKIPPGIIIGYDAGVPSWSPWPWEREYFRAQYMLAPTPLMFEKGPWLVVLNYPCDASVREAVASGRYSLVWPADLPHEGERGDERGVALALRLMP